jgi:hypothetical protein
MYPLYDLMIHPPLLMTTPLQDMFDEDFEVNGLTLLIEILEYRVILVVFAQIVLFQHLMIAEGRESYDSDSTKMSAVK